MPLLTKKFTRDSLKRANGGGISNGNDDHAKAEMIQREMARARANSMRNRNVLNQQHRRNRSLTTKPSSPYRSFALEEENPKIKQDPEGPKPATTSAHPNDEYSQAFHEAELLTQMSSLTEPTWAPSVVGGSETKKRQSNQIQRSRTANYSNNRYQTRFRHNSTRADHNRTTIAISTSKDNESERREDDEPNTTRLSEKSGRADTRDGDAEEKGQLSTSKTKISKSTRRSKLRGADDESNASRTRGRSGRPSSNRKSRRRSSSISSERSKDSARTMSTAPTIAKDSSTVSSRSMSLTSRKSKTTTAGVIGRRRTIGGRETSSSVSSRSSSVPPSTSNSKRSQRTSSVPPNMFEIREMRRSRYGDAREQKQSSKTNADFTKIVADSSLETAPTMEDLTAASSQSISRSKVSFATGSESFSSAPTDSASIVSSEIEAARMSLRPRLRRSNSNRSISSAQSGSIVSRTSKGPYDESPRDTASTKKSRKQKQMTRMESKERRRKRKEEKRGRKEEARADALAIDLDGSEPHPTAATTLLFDILLFHLFLFLSLPKRVVFTLWSLMFTKKWTARRKNVLVTCANSALGSETARQFAAEGANLVLVSHLMKPSEDGLDRLVEECRALGSGKTKSYSADLSSAISIEVTLRQAAKDFDDTFDVVVLSGETKSHGCLFEEILDVHHIKNMVTENTLGCIVALHYALPHIPKSSDSRIVILSSTLGVVASPYRSIFGATQYALKGFCDSIRMELNGKYTERRAPKICFASLPELVGQNIQSRESINHRVSQMGADTSPIKTRSWAGVPLQQAVHDLLGAITSGERHFGTPRYVNAWRIMQVLAPRLADFSVTRHFQRTLYRPVEDCKDSSKERKGFRNDGASVSNKTWS